MIFLRFFLILLVFMPVSGAYALDENRPLSPEMATETLNKSLLDQTVKGNRLMAVTAHPEATMAAYEILKAGGTAADAGIAAQMVLGLVEPQSSGIGGGGFALYYDAKQEQLFTLDGREIAPSLAGNSLFINDDGKPLGFYEAANSGMSVGVPGLLRMLEKLHNWQGKKSWSELFYPAIKLAEKGFEVSPRLHGLLKQEKGRWAPDVKAKIYFYPDTVQPLEVGKEIRNPDYAVTLRNIAQNGVDVFYDGELTKEIVKKVREARTAPGLLSYEDMKNYEAVERRAVCADYRGYKVCSMGQPSSGALTLLMTLGMLEHFDLRKLGAESPVSWHIISEASRLAFADRNQYMADPDYVPTPNTLLLQPEYLKGRASLIKTDKAMMEVTHGMPPRWNPEIMKGVDDRTKNTGTTHITIRDMYGNILSMTTSIENAFGSRLMVGGFLLNNQLTDFSFEPLDEKGEPVANRVEGGKRPRSSMTPTIIFDPNGQPFMVIGSAGGSRIIGYVLQRIIAVIDWDMNLQDALDMPNILHRGKKLEVETDALNFAEPLKNLGHPVLVGGMNSGLTAIQFKNGKIYGAADPRRDGIAMGE
jgi:gamma-glutamyltranspeptidase/glutathione hydrolase